MGTDFYLNSGTLANSSVITISPNDAIKSQQLSIWVNDVQYPIEILNGENSESLFETRVNAPVKLDIQFDGTDWSLTSFKNLANVSYSTFPSGIVYVTNEGLGNVDKIDVLNGTLLVTFT